ncbi:hypothetical protein [Corynebacterium mastitidis]|uniref:hypothetical protein n=1 Tax=Corynebacterium mastitidis TaxID=161890 RepID=UPI00254A622E|nr:hypothetical protein [Corynebacterium mastitidis]MDK8450164.1 hypothetical protein [Corynebacterium mastitidis]
MMRRLVCLLACCWVATGCATQRTVEYEQPTLSREGIRTPDDPILGAVTEEGSCDPAVLSADGEELVYHGQPGDRIEITIDSPASAEPRTETIEMGSTDTERRVDVGEWSALGVKASGRVGLPGECSLSHG